MVPSSETPTTHLAPEPASQASAPSARAQEAHLPLGLGWIPPWASAIEPGSWSPGPSAGLQAQAEPPWLWDRRGVDVPKDALRSDTAHWIPHIFYPALRDIHFGLVSRGSAAEIKTAGGRHWTRQPVRGPFKMEILSLFASMVMTQKNRVKRIFALGSDGFVFASYCNLLRAVWMQTSYLASLSLTFLTNPPPPKKPKTGEGARK